MDALRMIFGFLLAASRMTIVVMLIAFHGLLIALLPEQSHKARAKVIRSWGWSITKTLGIRIVLRGQPSSEHAILIATHKSYADIPVLAGLKPVVFLAKAELATWPIMGWTARKARTVFVDRNSPESRERSRHTLRQRISEGLSVLVFSEGTTSSRGVLKPLKAGMFHEAAAADLPIQLVYVEFAEDEDSWVDEMSVATHFFARFSRWRTEVLIDYRSELLRGDREEAEPGRRMCEEATQWFQEQIRREVGELRG